MSIAIFRRCARRCEKHAREVHQSPRNNGTPIPWDTLEYTENQPKGCTKYTISLVLLYSEKAPERAKKRQRRPRIIKEQRYTNSMRNARIYEKPTKGVYKLLDVIGIASFWGCTRRCEKLARKVHKSPSNSGTPISCETLEYTKNSPQGLYG